MAEHANQEKGVFSLGDPTVADRCPRTGRLFEVGSGALPHDQQTANYVREAARAADMPCDGDYCPQTGRHYEFGSGALTKTAQSRLFLDELSPAEKAQRLAAAKALAEVDPAGRG